MSYYKITNLKCSSILGTHKSCFVEELHKKWLGNGGRDPVLMEINEMIRDLIMDSVRMLAGNKYFGGGKGNNTEDSLLCQKAMGHL